MITLQKHNMHKTKINMKDTEAVISYKETAGQALEQNRAE
jgi:hypothetical protein